MKQPEEQSDLSVPEPIKCSYSFHPSINQVGLLIEVHCPLTDLPEDWQALLFKLALKEQEKEFNLDANHRVLFDRLVKNIPAPQSERDIDAKPSLNQYNVVIKLLNNQNNKKSESAQHIDGQAIIRKLLYVLHEDEELNNELTHLYVPLQASFSRSGTSPFDLDQQVTSFIEDKKSKGRQAKKVILLLAEGGSGKSMFCQRKALKLESEYERKKIVPLYIPLGIIREPVEKLLEEFFEEISLSREEIEWLRKQEAVLFLDAYDESRQKKENLKNFYVSNKLWLWPHLKVIETCRTSHLKGTSNYQDLFVPGNQIRLLPDELAEVYIIPFSPEKRIDYIEGYIKYKSEELNDYEEKWRQVRTYEDYILEIRGLDNVTKTPLFLKITMEVLQKIAKKYEDLIDKEHYKCTGRELMREYMNLWFIREKRKLIKEDKNPSSVDMMHKYPKYCKKLANAMASERNGEGIYIVTWPETHSQFKDKEKEQDYNRKWKTFFGAEEGSVQYFAFRGSPLCKPGLNSYAFLHPRIRAYFNTNKQIAETEAMSEEDETDSSENILKM